MSSHVPADMINLRLILVSGKTKEFLFSPNDSASDIAKHVYDNWPMDWEEEQVSSPNILRLIYQGRFLHGNVTLGALKLPFGKTTVMHLVARETLPEPNSQGQRNREKTGESNCCVILWHVAARAAVCWCCWDRGLQQHPPLQDSHACTPWGWITRELCHLFLESKKNREDSRLVLYSCLSCLCWALGNAQWSPREVTLLPRGLIPRSQKSSVPSTVCTTKRQKIIVIFLISRICQRLWCPETLLWQPTLEDTQRHSSSPPGQSHGGNGKGSKMLGEFYQSQPPWSAVLTGYQTGRDCPHCSKGKAMPAAHSTAEGTSAASALTPPGRELIQTAQRAGSSSTLALT